MIGSGLARLLRRVAVGLAVLTAAWAAWVLFPGMPVVGGPHASVQVKEVGLTIFEHDWKQGDPLAGGDGLGPVFNERSCVACHFQGGVGGGGDVSKNVMAFEVHPVPGRPQVCEGIVHAFSISKDCSESRVGLNDFFHIVPGGLKIVGSCFVEIRDFDPVRTESVNTTALFGAGWIDRISSRSHSPSTPNSLLQCDRQRACRRSRRNQARPGSRTARRSNRQIRLESPVCDAQRVRGFRVCE